MSASWIGRATISMLGHVRRGFAADVVAPHAD
jgi:hypothetical protein